MTEKRQLLAIMFTDIVGYTATMGKSEPRAVEMLHKNRELHRELIARHSGEYLQEIGDGILASFASAVDAVGCALELQRAAGQDPDLTLRVGIHSGDVIQKGGDIIGDAVNVASRIEPLAAAGGICVSDGVYESVRNKPGIGGIFLGAKSFKNVSEPVRVHGLTGEGLPAEADIRKAAEKVPSLKVKGPFTRLRLALAALALVVLSGIGHTFLQQRKAEGPAPIGRTALPIPDKPSLAVLPFVNMSGDPEQGYFADGMTEDLITDLSRLSGLFVIARTSTFAYKGRPVKVQQVSRELGVRYVLEGSVRKMGSQVRITAQLIDATTGHHLWADRYDRELEGLFSVQDDITNEIVSALSVELTEGEQGRVWREHTRSLEAWDLMAQGLSHFYRFSEANNTLAREAFQRATEVDPEYALAFALRAWTHWMDAMHGWGESRSQSIDRAADLAQTALALDDALPDVYALLGGIHLLKREYEEAIAVGIKAVSLNPNHSNNIALLANTLLAAEQPRAAIRRFREAIRLSPAHPTWYLEVLGIAHFEAGEYEEALEVVEKFLEREPAAEHAAHAYLTRAAAYDALGREREARAAVAAALKTDPEISVRSMCEKTLRKDREAADRAGATLLRLGLPP